MSKQRVDSHSLLIIFSHINDMKTLYGSCSLVCREWYRKFFAKEYCADDEQSLWRRNLQPLDDPESFCKIFDKVIYLNGIVNVLDLPNQYSEWMGTAKRFTLYDQLEQELLLDSDINGKVLRKGVGKVEKLFKKKYLTLSSYCQLVASVRNPRLAIRKLSKANSIPTMFQDCIASCCQFMVAVVDEYSNGSSISFYSSVDDKCLLKEFKIGKNVTISQIVLTYHPLKNSEHRKALNIDPKLSDVNIYCLYVLYSDGSEKSTLKKYLVCDKLEGELLVKESCEMTREIYSENGYLSVPGWEHFGMDLVVFLTSYGLIYFINNSGIIYYMATDKEACPSITNYSGNNVIPNYLINFTKSLRNRGFSLVQPNGYSNYSAFTLQYAGINKNDDLYVMYVYVVIDHKYSVFYNTSPKYIKHIDGQPPDSIKMDRDKRDYSKKILKLLNQGKEAIIHSSYCEVNDEGRNPKNFSPYYDYGSYQACSYDERYFCVREEISKIELR